MRPEMDTGRYQEQSVKGKDKLNSRRLVGMRQVIQHKLIAGVGVTSPPELPRCELLPVFMIASPLLLSSLTSSLPYRSIWSIDAISFYFLIYLDSSTKWSPPMERQECSVKVSEAIVIRRQHQLTSPDGIHVDMNHLKSGEVK